MIDGLVVEDKDANLALRRVFRICSVIGQLPGLKQLLAYAQCVLVPYSRRSPRQSFDFGAGAVSCREGPRQSKGFRLQGRGGGEAWGLGPGAFKGPFFWHGQVTKGHSQRP